MALNLPDPTTRYFAADKQNDPAALAACFTPDATVTDEGRTYAGQEAIREWMASASTQYTYSVAPLSLARADASVIVTSRLVGNFPGSPVDLRYAFVLAGEQIASLEIAA